MPLFSTVDLIALVWFLAAWLGYSFVIETTERGLTGLNGLMHRYRELWMQRMLARLEDFAAASAADTAPVSRIPHHPRKSKSGVAA